MTRKGNHKEVRLFCREEEGSRVFSKLGSLHSDLALWNYWWNGTLKQQEGGYELIQIQAQERKVPSFLNVQKSWVRESHAKALLWEWRKLYHENSSQDCYAPRTSVLMQVGEDKMKFQRSVFHDWSSTRGGGQETYLKSDKGRKSHSTSFSRFKFHLFHEGVDQMRTEENPRLWNKRI